MNIRTIAENLMAQIPDADVRDIFLPCFLNTWETTCQYTDDGKPFVITGDIPAMWLRDSSAQVQHYLPFCNKSEEVRTFVSGLIHTQIECILLDPYANAFNKEANGMGHQDDITDMGPAIWERKYEIDSLCYPIRLAYQYWKITDDTSIFTDAFLQAMQVILDLWVLEQDHNQSSYTFQRNHGPKTDTLTNEGKGADFAVTGMTWCGFRPSDDACQYPYLVPSNMFAVAVLQYMQEIAKKVYQAENVEKLASKLAAEIRSGIEKYAIDKNAAGEPMYAYEVDGLGNKNYMDDANVPSLLSIPYLGFTEASDPIYVNTRAFILSEENPYFYEGKFAKGIGSPHTPENYIWHIALSMQGLTSTDEEERKNLIQTLVSTTGGTGFMHEGFNVDNPNEFTRDWFAWANSIFAEFVIDYYGLKLDLDKE